MIEEDINYKQISYELRFKDKMIRDNLQYYFVFELKKKILYLFDVFLFLVIDLKYILFFFF